MLLPLAAAAVYGWASMMKCADLTPSQVEAKAKNLGVIDVASCADVLAGGLCLSPEAEEFCCASCSTVSAIRRAGSGPDCSKDCLPPRPPPPPRPPGHPEGICRPAGWFPPSRLSTADVDWLKSNYDTRADSTRRELGLFAGFAVLIEAWTQDTDEPTLYWTEDGPRVAYGVKLTPSVQLRDYVKARHDANRNCPLTQFCSGNKEGVKNREGGKKNEGGGDESWVKGLWTRQSVKDRIDNGFFNTTWTCKDKLSDGAACYHQNYFFGCPDDRTCYEAECQEGLWCTQSPISKLSCQERSAAKKG